MAGLLDRLQATMGARGLNQRQWSRDAGLSSGHIGTLTTRLRADPNASVEHQTLAKLAAAARVSLEWLATGNGPSGLDAPARAERTPPPEPTLEREEQPEYSDDRAPVLRNLPNWRRLEEAARVLAPEVPDWVWARVREAPPLPQLVSAGAIADLARLHMRYLTEPGDR